MIRETLRALSPLAWALVAAVVLAIVVGGWWVVTEPGRQRQKAAEAEVAARLSDARADAAGEAVAIQDDVAAETARSERLSRETADAIRNAPGADQRLDPGLNRAARQRLCLRAAYRDRPECVQRPGGAEP